MMRSLHDFEGSDCAASFSSPRASAREGGSRGRRGLRAWPTELPSRSQGIALGRQDQFPSQRGRHT